MEDPSRPLAFLSPPIDDINEMADLKRSAFSLKDHIAKSEVFREAASQRLEELSLKVPKFSASPTLHNRLSNLLAAVGNLELGLEASERAYKLKSLPFFARKLGDSLAQVGNIERAKSVFHNFHEVDSYSALRLASFCIVERDLSGAERWVQSAVELNPAGYAERLFEGAIHLIAGDFKRAVAVLRIALDAKPASSVAYTNLGFAYLGMHRPDKAFHALKRSVALDPFNKSALIALSDTAIALGRNEDAVNSLRYFVQFEQRDASVWGRLARALLQLNLVDDCIHALKRQGALDSTASVWNNLGVAYDRKGRTAESITAFKHALSLSTNIGLEQELLVARNVTAQICKQKLYEHVVQFVEDLIGQDDNGLIARDDRFSDLYSTYIFSLAKLGRQKDAMGMADSLLSLDGLSSSLGKWLLVYQSAVYGLERNQDAKLSELLDRYASHLSLDSHKDLQLINNIAFSLAELGRLDEASKWISRASWAVHKDAYVTATTGLINVRKGSLERGEALYREAVALAKSSSDKARIRQKMHVELGRAWSQTHSRKGARLLTKAVEERHGEKALTKQALQSLSKIRSAH